MMVAPAMEKSNVILPDFVRLRQFFGHNVLKRGAYGLDQSF